MGTGFLFIIPRLAIWCVLDKEVAIVSSIFVVERCNELIRHGHVQQELVEDAMSSASLHVCILACIDWPNGTLVN
jgi:hypothetical protein